MIDTQLEDKIVLVTGGNHGIGAATAKAFAKQSAKVFITYYRPDRSQADEEMAKEPGEKQYRQRQKQTANWVVEEIHQLGGQAQAWELDLSNAEKIPELFDRTEKAFGSVDVLVNNAAYCKPDTFIPKVVESEHHMEFDVDTITAKRHNETFAINSRATALMTAEFARRHIDTGKDWGRIINISTDAASAHPLNVSYAASKYALESYSHSAASELGPYGITVNIVSPGPTQTGYIPPQQEKELAKQIPLQRIGWPEDIADVVVFLASEQARWVTGQKIYVGGGNKMPL